MRKQPPSSRSPCPLNIALEMVGDRWSLLILRDLMVRNAKTFKDLMACPEKIASNILANRLRKLIGHGIIKSTPDPLDARKAQYALTPKGMDLAPAIAELVLWIDKHEKHGNQPLARVLRERKVEFIAELRAQWEK